MIITVLLSIGIGLLVNEFCEVSPWLARKLIRWSAFCRYSDPDRAQARAEELAAVINDRPGKVLKLATACGFAASAGLARVRRRVPRLARLVIGSTSAVIGSGGVMSAIVWVAGHHLTITQAIGQTCMALTWVVGGVTLAFGKPTDKLTPTIPVTLGLTCAFGCVANIAFYLYGGGVGHLIWAAIVLCFLLAEATFALMWLHDERLWHRYQVLRDEHDALYPDCTECFPVKPGPIEQHS